VAEFTVAEGTYSLTALSVNALSAESLPTLPQLLVADFTRPNAPLVASPAPGAVLIDQQVTIRGSAEPGATVTVTIDAGAPQQLTAAGDGSWSLEVTLPLGTRSVVATATDPAGNVSETTRVAFTIERRSAGGGGGGGCSTGAGGSGASAALFGLVTLLLRRRRS
jgi:uncharacterized protein (TIGR03382 family)